MALRSTGRGFFRMLRDRCASSLYQRCPSLIQFSWLSSSSASETSLEQPTKIDERFVLDQLSELLTTDGKISIRDDFTVVSVADCCQRSRSSAIDSFLSDAEKLRGVFLQKLVGKARIESALTATDVELTEETVKQVVDTGNLCGEAIVSFFRWAVKRPGFFKDLRSYNIFLKALGRRRFFDHMERLLDELRRDGLRPSLETFSIVVDSYVRVRRVLKAVQFFERLEEFGFILDCDHFNVLLECLCKRNHVRMADSLLKATRKKIDYNKTTYNIVIGGWARSGRVKEMKRNWNEMINKGLLPDSLTFSYLIEGFGRNGQIEESVHLFESMEDKGCPRTTGNYNSIIFNFAAVGDLDRCLKYYKDMLPNKADCSPNIDTYARLINSFLKVKRVADAIELYAEMMSRGITPSAGMVTAFVDPLCTFGPPHAALLIYDKAKGSGCEISSKTYKVLLMRLARFGKCGMMMRVWEEMKESGISSDAEVYEHLVNGFCNIGQLENAILVVEESLSKGFCPNKIIYSKLNNKLLNASKVEIAYRLFLKIKRARNFENARRFWRSNGWHF